MKKLIYLIILLVLIAGGYWLINKTREPFEVFTPDPMADWKTYRNEKYGFEFKYPDEWKLKECPSYSIAGGAVIPCAFVDKGFRLWPHTLEVVRSGRDCDADGPGGSTYCSDIKIQDYENPNNVKGYKVSRNLVYQTINPASKINPAPKTVMVDIAYSFEIGDSEYPQFLFSVDAPTEEKLDQLSRVVETLKIIP